MPYHTTVTQKGQITIPKEIRDMLRLGKNSRVAVQIEKGNKGARLIPLNNFVSSGRRITPKKRTNPLKARASMEKKYARK